MRIDAIAERGASRPASLGAADYRAFRELARCLSAESGPVLAASTYLGYGEAGGGGYVGHAEIYDLDGLLRDLYGSPSLAPGVNDALFGGGKGFRLADAMLSTVGEAVERAVATLVAGTPDLPGRRVVCSYAALRERGLDAVEPTRLGLFSDAQYESLSFLYARFGEETVVQWVEGRRLRAGTPVWVPAQLVDMVHIYDTTEEFVGYPVSGGLSCHTSWTAAVYHGLTEAIERDAVNVSWYTGAVPRRLLVDDAVRELLGGFLERLELDNSESHILVHASGLCGAPTFSVVGFRDWLTGRQYCAGGGCDVVPATALRKAAAEFAQTRAMLGVATAAPRSAVARAVETMFDWDADRPFSEMTLFFQAIGYYGLAENRPLLDPYLSGPVVSWEELVEECGAPGPAAGVEERLGHVLGELADHGVDPIVLDYSHPDWTQLAIAKVYVPELSTPFLQSRPMLGHERLARLRDSVVTPDGSALPLPYP